MGKWVTKIYLIVLVMASIGHLVFAIRTNNYFSTDDFAILAYFKDHSILAMIPDFLIHGDIYHFRRLVGFIVFGGIFKLFSVNHLAFDVSMFLTNTACLFLLYSIVKKLTKNDFTAFFVSLIFNKNYLFYYSNIHEHLLALFCLLTIYFFINYPKKFYLSSVSLILALFTKETAVTVPLILLGISKIYKMDRKKIYYLLSISFIYGLYALYFFITKKVYGVDTSYESSIRLKDIVSGILFFVDIKVLILVTIIPIFTKKMKLIPLLLFSLLTLLPASILINRRELYYLYMPFGYLMIYLGMILPKLNFKSIVLYLLVVIVFGGRQILPKIAWHKFPNWQKVSMEKVLDRVEKGSNDFSDINLERDAKLMIESKTIDLFLNYRKKL